MKKVAWVPEVCKIYIYYKLQIWNRAKTKKQNITENTFMLDHCLKYLIQ